MSENTFKFEDFKNIVDNQFNAKEEIEWKDMTFTIKTLLSFEEMMRFVKDVVTSCFAIDTGEYLPEIKDFSMRCCILEYYAGITLPEDISEKYRFVYSSDIVFDILGNVNTDQFRAIRESIDRKINHLAKSNINSLTKQFGDFTLKLDAMVDGLSKAFNGIDSETISKIAETISNGSFDEFKLVEAFKTKPESDE